MKNKFLKIGLPIIIVVLIVVSVSVGIPFSRHMKIKKAEKNLYEQYFTLPESCLITAENGVYGQKKNSLLYIKTAYENGADCVEVDIVFDEKGVPYVCENEDKISQDDAMPLEYLFKTVDSEDDYDGNMINLHLVQASNLSAIDTLAEKYHMTDRIFYTGVTANQASYVSSQSSVGFYLDYELDEKKADDEDYIQQVFLDVSNSCAIGINCEVDGFSDALGSMLKETWLKISFHDVDTELEMYRALSFSPDQIITSKPEELLEKVHSWSDNAPIEYYGITSEEK